MKSLCLLAAGVLAIANPVYAVFPIILMASLMWVGLA
jgi:hypothetical protein